MISPASVFSPRLHAQVTNSLQHVTLGLLPGLVPSACWPLLTKDVFVHVHVHVVVVVVVGHETACACACCAVRVHVHVFC